MAQYVADLITRAEHAPAGPEREELRRECAREVLRLWSHRRAISSDERPMATYEELHRALARLDPEAPPWAFYRSFDAKNAPTPEQVASNALLSTALAVESAARDVVRSLVYGAAQVASTKEAKWVKLARKLPDDEFSFLKSLDDLMESGVDDDEEAGADTAAPDARTLRDLKKLTAACERAQSLLMQSRGDQEETSQEL
ncbi:hypothetical protein [Micromonospora sp. SL4-19]|uniref:hypothetical protein n=1 Tax=Micromonospora sp. SL4-19 TaxID=3399129 RepID=UPI003A4E3AD0